MSHLLAGSITASHIEANAIRTATIAASSVTSVRIKNVMFTIHGMDVSIEEIVKLFELSIDKEKLETMIVALRITEKEVTNNE